ncbi:zinc finger, CCHC-type containing protein [Tanacetum coccineum]
MKLFQDMQLIQKLLDDQKRMKKVFEDMSEVMSRNPIKTEIIGRENFQVILGSVLQCLRLQDEEIKLEVQHVSTSSGGLIHRCVKGSISTWENITTRFLAQFFPPGSIAKLQNDILMFQQHQVQLFNDRIDHTLKRTVDYAAEGRLRKMSAEKAWATIEELARYEDEGWSNLIFLEEGSLNYKNPNIKQLLGVMECKVDELMKNEISLMKK